MISTDRRTFFSMTGAAFAGLVASGGLLRAQTAEDHGFNSPYGPLLPDPAGLLDLPHGFSLRVISRVGDMMDDGERVPDRADGMGCFALPSGKIALVRNHELKIKDVASLALPGGYDRRADGLVLAGGTTTLVLDAKSLHVERRYRSLAGTIRNCAGGMTPWGSWLSCEEDVSRAGEGVERDHGWVFEVPADSAGLVDPVPVVAMGRFNHEAAAVDPRSGIVYLTEDRDDGLLYRFIPDQPGKLAIGGRLQALAVQGLKDSRNWDAPLVKPRAQLVAEWVDLDDVESPQDDLRLRGMAEGALPFARGEGIHMGDGELYFTCTSGGAARQGQIFRLIPGLNGKDRLELFFESSTPEQFSYGDNLTVAPNGHLIVCEDRADDEQANFLRGVTPQGKVYPFARLHAHTELAGACFSPDGKTLFVNAYKPAMTFAITGPWAG